MNYTCVHLGTLGQWVPAYQPGLAPEESQDTMWVVGRWLISLFHKCVILFKIDLTLLFFVKYWIIWTLWIFNVLNLSDSWNPTTLSFMNTGLMPRCSLYPINVPYGFFLCVCVFFYTLMQGFFTFTNIINHFNVFALLYLAFFFFFR